MLIKENERHLQPSNHAGITKKVLIGRGVLPKVTQVATTTIAEGQSTDRHVHPTMFEAFYVLEGEAVYFLGDEEFHVAPGDYLIVPPGTPHYQTVTRGPHRILYWGVETD